ncbi:MAG: hypothetical protein OEM32_02230 [Acidimicrobiia bacterium]|nr:hypothetical protein [Acidimicrobiia bacterium]
MTETMNQQRSTTELLKRYATLAYGAFGTMMDTGFVVVGTLLVGLGISVVLGGFGIVGQLTDITTGAMLGSALILGVVGMFFLGVAAEGPLGRGRRLRGFALWEIGIGRAISGFLVGLGLLLIHSFIGGFLTELPGVLERGSDGIYAAAVAGMMAVPLVGVPISLLVRSLPDAYAWGRRYEIPALFLVWVIATMVLL